MPRGNKMAGDKDGNMWAKVEIKTDGTPEQVASFLIDWFRRNYTSFGMVPRLIFNEGGSLARVEGVNAPDDVLIAYTYDEAFAILNDGKLPEDIELDPGYRYIHRRKGKIDGVYVAASVYHRIDAQTGLTSLCGAVRAGAAGYEIIIKDKPLLQSRLCNNCLRGITIVRGEK
jgi:hypothetical protein